MITWEVLVGRLYSAAGWSKSLRAAPQTSGIRLNPETQNESNKQTLMETERSRRSSQTNGRQQQHEE